MKAYKDPAGGIRVFRPIENAIRLNKSSSAICFPQYDPDEFVKCLCELLKLEADWLPDRPGTMYIRPTVMSMTNQLGLHPPHETKLFIALSPVESYFPSGLQPLKILVESEGSRSWKGGIGDMKLGANYAIGMRYLNAAFKRGLSFF